MPEILVPRENLVACSDIIDSQISYLAERMIDFREDRAMDVALKAMKRTVPGIIELYRRPTLVEANGIFQIHDGGEGYFSSGSFEGVLARVSIEKIIKNEYVDFLDHEVVTEGYDLALVFRQRIVNPDPAPLGYSDEILVPVGGIETLCSAA